jgi:hypothetical protein
MIETSNDRYIKKFIIILLISIWFVMSLILSKSFSDSLLLSYFKLKLSPIISSLEDIEYNLNLKIVTGNILTNNYIQHHYIYKSLYERYIQTKKYYNKTNSIWSIFLEGIMSLVLCICPLFNLELFHFY